MLKRKVLEILQKTDRSGHLDEQIKDHFLYLVNDGRTVFYVGKTEQELGQRLRQHVAGALNSTNSDKKNGQDKKDDIALGNLILANLPKSLEWTVRFYTVADCAKFISRCFVSMSDDFSLTEFLQAYSAPANKQWAIERAEKTLIRYYGAYCNISNNPLRGPLPDKYRRGTGLDDADMGEELVDLLEKQGFRGLGRTGSCWKPHNVCHAEELLVVANRSLTAKSRQITLERVIYYLAVHSIPYCIVTHSQFAGQTRIRPSQEPDNDRERYIYFKVDEKKAAYVNKHIFRINGEGKEKFNPSVYYV